MNLPDERRKLTAAWLNSIASGAVVTGFIAPTIAVALNLGGAVPGWPLALLSLGWLALGCVQGAFSEDAMTVLEIYVYFVLPALVLGIGFGTLWLTRRPDRRSTPAE